MTCAPEVMLAVVNKHMAQSCLFHCVFLFCMLLHHFSIFIFFSLSTVILHTSGGSASGGSAGKEADPHLLCTGDEVEERNGEVAGLGTRRNPLQVHAAVPPGRKGGV